MADDNNAFEHAERFVLEGEDGVEETWVMLAIHEIDGQEYALLASEAGLNGPEDDMDVVVFRYDRAGDGQTELVEIEDEALYERVYEQFAELMGLEEADED